ncbi:hypothetical protein BDV95DRAFT_596029 [Massariosphaeria phaeospora]|uniref:Mre11 DNA-binding domain-containing protein n=1 Tax=Massariosphaeria phaeospora TaxID=100035 RepID=A0A7C8I377_9PLEO|nr:hypothetical protein BDV95DRAFT_596029 [Massariosphaeria phaeospora]
MPPRAAPRGADTIRVLLATDNHVGYNERDSERHDDSWKTFHEIMSLAKEHDVDMVLHAGDLFHENKPSRKAMYQVMRSLRMNCLGDKPCELEMLSDASENFGGVFDHVNYEDPDINVAIPVFAIHGNHDDPSGEGSFSPLDLLQVSGLVNYYGRASDADDVSIKPVLLQKGGTKLALYGLSNVRDERLFRTWRDGKVKFFQPGTQKDEWFNLMSVHQNHYLPENFLPEFLDLIIWGHEHECLIEPRYNPEMGFHVIQPGSSIATSLMPGEAVPKHVAILSITGKEFTTEAIRLKTVRPFVMKEIVLADEREIKEKQVWRMSDNRNKISEHLEKIVHGLIEEARREWLEVQDDRVEGEDIEVPKPLVRLRVEYTAPDPGEFICENPQRFSRRFQGKVANTSDVVQYYRKKKAPNRALKNNADLPDESVMDQLSLDSVKVEKLVKEFLAAQSLTILPQNSFGDAVAQFVDKDDKHAMEMFVNESLANQLKHLMESNEVDEDDIVNEMEGYRTRLEELFASGQLKKSKKKLKPKPDFWDSDMDGEWADQPGALIHTDAEMEDDDPQSIPAKKPAARGRAKAVGTTRATASAAKKPPAARAGRGKKKVIEEEEEEDDYDGDAMVIVSDDDEEAEDLFVRPTKTTTKKPATRAPARTKSPPKKAPARGTRQAATKQSTLNFSQPSTQRSQATRAPRGRKAQEPVLLVSILGLVWSRGSVTLASTALSQPTGDRKAAAFRRPSTALTLTMLIYPSPLPSRLSFFSCHHHDGPDSGEERRNAAWAYILRLGRVLHLSHTHLSAIFLFHPSSFVIAALRLLDSCHSFVLHVTISFECSLVSAAAPFVDTNIKSSHIQRGGDTRIMSLAYKVEELLALRDSVSESAVSLDKFADEDVIKEHVLRPSASATLKTASSENNIRSSITPLLAPAAPNKKPSPSPSIKRGKAERLLKEHGSPPGMRVTAGGRVVPSDLPPLSTARFGGNNSFKPQAPRATTDGDPMSAHIQPDVPAPHIQIVGDQAVLCIGERMFALSAAPPVVSGATGTTAKPMMDAAMLPVQGYVGHPQRAHSQSPYPGVDLQGLKTQQNLKRQELRLVEQTEVLQAGQQTEAWRAGMIEKKKNLILELDNLRKQISAAEADNATSAPSTSFSVPAGNTANPIPPPAFVPQMQQSMGQSMFAFPAQGAYPPPLMYPPQYGAFPGSQPEVPQYGRDSQLFAPAENPTNGPHSPGSASRRSRAIEIKPPPEETKKNSRLDPKSPTYEPMAKVESAKEFVPPTPSPAKRSPWRRLESKSMPSDKHEDRVLTQKLSLSSIDTTDFFPTNTHEHSSTRLAPTNPSKETTAVPSTPEKNWPASPWNEGNAARSSAEQATKLTLWPEAFGKQPSLTSLKAAASTQHVNTREQAGFSSSSEALKPTYPRNAASRKTSEQRTATEETWPMVSFRPVAHPPSTYQEGYQAGYDHVGIPDSPDVLKGFIEGLLQFISDESKMSRVDNYSLRNLTSTGAVTRESLRGMLTPQDSGIGMTFNSTGPLSAGQENVRSAKSNLLPEERRDSAYSEAPLTQVLYNEAIQEQRFRDNSTVVYLNSEATHRMGPSYRHVTMPASDHEMSMKNQDNRSQSRAESALANNMYIRQTAGSQLSNRANGTPIYMQRYYPTPKEYGMRALGSVAPLCARTWANNVLSGLDGAMDDLSSIMVGPQNTRIDEQRNTRGQDSTAVQRSSEDVAPATESPEADASCFKATTGKGKQKVTSSPSKSSPANASGSPKKAGEHSPAKAKLEQVTNKFRRSKKDEPRNLSPDEKRKRSEKWHGRFTKIRTNEIVDMNNWIRDNPRKPA